MFLWPGLALGIGLIMILGQLLSDKADVCCRREENEEKMELTS